MVVRWSRVASLGLLLLCPGWLAAAEKAAPEKHVLRSRRAAGALDRVEMSVEVGGNYRMPAPRDGEGKAAADAKAATEKISAVASFAYDEKTLAAPRDATEPWRSVRHYDTANLVLKTGQSGQSLALSGQRRLLGVEVQGTRIEVFSPHGPLTRDELDLADVDANSLVLERLLPADAVAVGDSWKIPDEAVQLLLHLESLADAKVEARLAEVQPEGARVEFAGALRGRLAGRAVNAEIKGKYRFDPKTGRIAWFGLVVKEDSAIGAIDFGLDVVAKVQVKIAPLAASPALAEEKLAALTLRPAAPLRQLVCRPRDGVWELTHDRRWYTISGADRSSVVLRLVDGDTALANLSVTTLAPLGSDKEVTLADFQENVRQTLGEKFRSFVEADAAPHPAGYRMFRVVVAGEDAQTPTQWRYYRLQDKQGRPAVAIFTLSKDNLEKFGDEDAKLVAGFRFAE